MGITVGNDWRQPLIFGCLLAMIAAAFVSRAALSISMIAFLTTALLHKNIGQQLCNFLKTPWLLGMAGLFLIPFISGLWSSNLDEWQDLMRIKLPLLFFPLAYAGNWQLTNRQWFALALFFLVLLLLGSGWSFWQYAADRQAINESYLRAKVFATPLGNDHVRFSWLVSAGVLCCLVLWQLSNKVVRWLLGITLLWFAVYLHLLAARTGLVLFYLVLGAYAVRMVWQKRSRWMVLLLIMLLLLPVAAWVTLPTFQNRIRYFLYDLSFIKQQTYLPGANDGNRVLSYKAGWHVLKTNPCGVGAGDTYVEVNKWYLQNVPGMLQTDKLYPSSEWLLYGGAAGWPGVLLFTIIMLLPFFYKPHRYVWAWYLLHAMAIFSFLIDIGLEVQFGVFLYSFIVLWWWKWFSAPNQPVQHA